jgi:putative ABC transport system permease protein
MRDLRHSLRTLLKQPLFSGIVIFTFALGIGANTAVFSVLNAVVLRPLPFHQPHHLVAFGAHDPNLASDDEDLQSISYPDFVDWRAQNRVFEDMAVYTNQSFTLTDGKEATHLQAEVVSASLFKLLGIAPALGRTFTEKEDEPGNRVVILSSTLWQRRFGGDGMIIGKSIVLDGESYQVVGVMPPRFAFPIGAFGPEIWTSMSFLRERSPDGSPPMTEQRGNSFMRCIARLKPDMSIQQAQANIDTITASFRQQYPDSDAHLAVRVVPLIRAMVAGARPALIMLCGMAACVLLVACVNVANLLLARSLSRPKEISIRVALGAGRWHIVKQLLTESALLGVGGGLAGILIATWGLEGLKAFLPANIPRVDEIAPDMRVLAFTGIVSVIVGALAGLLPAWRVSQPNLATALNETSRGSTEGASGRRTRAALVVVEIVLALVLLASAGLLFESFLRLQKVRPGFDPSNVMTARIALPNAAYGKPEQAAAFYEKLLARISILPGVQSAAAAWWVPLSGSDIIFNFDIQERPLPKSDQSVAQVNVITHDYFKTLRANVVRGRDFTARDDRNAPKVAIVSESFAKQFFPGEDPIGKRITPNGSIDPGDPPVREIIGVVQDFHLISLREAPKPQIYVPHQQFAVQSVSIFVRTRNDARSITASLTDAVHEIDKDVPIYRARLFTDYLSQSIAQPRLNAMLVGLFALVALLLAAAGIFGVMSYSVTQRTQEIGIRLALGAQRGDVLRLIVGHGMRLVVIGVVFGFVGIFVSTRLLQSLLFGIGATDLPTMLGVAFVLAGVAFAACWFPAMRAAQVDPVTALRSE